MSGHRALHRCNNDAVAYLREHHARITYSRERSQTKPWTERGVGTGDTPIKQCLTLIRANGYPIYCIVEREFQGAGTALEETRKDLEYMKNALA